MTKSPLLLQVFIPLTDLTVKVSSQATSSIRLHIRLWSCFVRVWSAGCAVFELPCIKC